MKNTKGRPRDKTALEFSCKPGEKLEEHKYWDKCPKCGSNKLSRNKTDSWSANLECSCGHFWTVQN